MCILHKFYIYFPHICTNEFYLFYEFAEKFKNFSLTPKTDYISADFKIDLVIFFVSKVILYTSVSP